MYLYVTHALLAGTRRTALKASPMSSRPNPPPHSPNPIYAANSQSTVQMSKCLRDAPPGSLYRRKLPHTLIDFNSAEGKRLFQSALQQGTAEAFFPLISQFQTQSHPALCGLTTLSTVLNALGIDPQRVWEHPWRWFAESLLDCCIDMDHVKTQGMTMDQLASTARCQGTDVKVLRDLGLDEARKLVVESVKGRQDGSFEFVVASYNRKSLGQTGSGHFSPIAAYDAASDSVLILDVARFKYGPHWVPFQDLFDATKPVDSATGMPRGFMAIRKGWFEDDVQTCPLGLDGNKTCHV